MSLFGLGSSLANSAVSAAQGAVGSVIGGLGKQLSNAISGGSGGAGTPFSATGGASPSDFIAPNLRDEYRVIIKGASANGSPIEVHGWLPEAVSFTTDSDWSAPFADGPVSETIGRIGQLMGRRWVSQGLSSQFWGGSHPVTFNLPLTFIAESGPQDLLGPIMSLYALQLPSISQDGFFIAPGPKLKAGRALAQSASNASSAVSQSFQQGGLLGAGKKIVSSAGSTIKTTTVSAIEGIPQLLTELGNVWKSGTAAEEGIKKAINDYFQFVGTISLSLGYFMLIDSVVLTTISNDIKIRLSYDGVPLSATVDVGFMTHQTPSIEDVVSWFQIRAPQQAQNGLSIGAQIPTPGQNMLSIYPQSNVNTLVSNPTLLGGFGS